MISNFDMTSSAREDSTQLRVSESFLAQRPIANSQICNRLIELTDDAYCTVKLYQELFATEPGLSAWVLRVANSKLLNAPVLTISEAIAKLGWKTVRGIVSALCLSCAKHKENQVLESVWEQSALRMIICRLICNTSHYQHAQKVESLGYFLGLGKSQMAALAPENYQEVLDLISNGCNPNEAEQMKFGFIGYTLSADLCSFWKLPISFRDALNNYSVGEDHSDAHDILALGELISCEMIHFATNDEQSEALQIKLGLRNFEQMIEAAQREHEKLKKLSGFL